MRSLIFGFLVGALILMLCLSGCTTPTTQPTPVTVQQTAPPTQQVQTTQPPATGPQALTGVTWYLISLGSISIKPGTQITAFFDAQGKVSGSAGCNQYTATYGS